MPKFRAAAPKLKPFSLCLQRPARRPGCARDRRHVRAPRVKPCRAANQSRRIRPPFSLDSHLRGFACRAATRLRRQAGVGQRIGHTGQESYRIHCRKVHAYANSMPASASPMQKLEAALACSMPDVVQAGTSAANCACKFCIALRVKITPKIAKFLDHFPLDTAPLHT